MEIKSKKARKQFRKRLIEDERKRLLNEGKENNKVDLQSSLKTKEYVFLTVKYFLISTVVVFIVSLLAMDLIRDIINNEESRPVATIIWWALVVLITVILFKNNRKEHKRWLSFPTLPQYKSFNSLGGGNPKCSHCGGTHIYSYGFESSSDNRRLHQCKSCSSWLYRSYG